MFVAVGSKYDISSYNVAVKWLQYGRLSRCHWILSRCVSVCLCMPRHKIITK